jgi:hypothetical protein
LGSFHAALAAWQDGPTRRRLIVAGVWMCVALLSRITTSFVVGPALLLVVLAVAHRSEGALPKRLGRAALVGLAITAAMALVSGWFYLRNQQLYGDLTGAKEALRLFGRKSHGDAEDLLLSGTSWGRLHEHLWVRLAGHVYLRGTAELMVDAIAALPLILVPKLLVDARRDLVPFLKSRSLVSYAVAVLAFVCVVVPMFVFHSRGGNLNARYLIPVLWLPFIVLAASVSSMRSAVIPQWSAAAFIFVSYVMLELYARALVKLKSAEVALPHALKAGGVGSPELVHLGIFLAVALGAGLVIGAVGELHRRFADHAPPDAGPGPQP